MAWDEWEQLKAEAATGSPHMQLNQLDPGSGPVRPAPDPGQYGELKASQADLAKIGSHAFDLYNDLWNKGRRAVPTSESAAGKLTAAGFALGSALQHVALRWDEQLGSLRDACAHPVSCSESGKQKEYDAPSALCGIPVDPNLFDLPSFRKGNQRPGKESGAQQDTLPGGHRRAGGTGGEPGVVGEVGGHH